MIFLLTILSILLSSLSAEACEIELLNGEISFSEPLPLAAVLPDHTNSCVQLLGSQLQTLQGLRTVTIAIRTEPEKRSEAISVAKAYVQALESGGISSSKISYLFPLKTTEEGIQVTYTARSTGISVAAISGLSGSAQIGTNQTEMLAAVIGQRLSVGSYVQTEANTKLNIALADGSQIRLDENTLIQLGTLRLIESGEKEIDLQLFSGEVDTQVSSAVQGTFQIRTSNTTAGVRGTKFRLAYLDELSLLETYEGEVLFANEKTSASVAAGFYANLAADQAEIEVLPLPPPPRIKSPRWGAVAPQARLRWRGSKGNSYHVELARDAEFSIDYYQYNTESTQLQLELPEGKWFWRVAAVNPTGFKSGWSLVYGFEVK
jgi:hypothetical protein